MEPSNAVVKMVTPLAAILPRVTRNAVVIGAAALVVVGLAHLTGLASSAGSREPTGPTTTSSAVELTPRLVTGVTLTGASTLRVVYEGAMCEDPAGYNLEETTSSVTITMLDAPSSGPLCRGGVALRTETVTLRSPLGHRQVDDGGCLYRNQAAGRDRCRITPDVA